MKRYPKLARCPFTGIFCKVRSEKEELAFIRTPLYAAAVSIVLYAIVIVWLIAS